MKFTHFQYIFCGILLVLASCADPAAIGSELLEEDRANLRFTDEVEVATKTVEGSAIQTYSPFTALQLSRHLFGQFEDPLLGISEAAIYSQISLGPQEAPDANIGSFDSIVLSLAYDTLGGYGDVSDPFEVEVFLMEEDLSSIDDYFSDQTFQTSAIPIGSATFVPSLEEELILQDYTANTEGDTVTVAPHLRIHLSGEIASILSDAAVYSSDTAFQNALKGIYLKPVKQTAGLTAFDFTNSISRISLYYQVGDDKREFQLDFNSGNARILTLNHNYEDALVNTFLNGSADSLLFVQGMVGVNAEISFPNIENLGNIAVNKAELVLTAANLSDNNSLLFPATSQLIAATGNATDGEILSDVRSALLGNSPINTNIFGGIPVEEDEVTTYKINLSGYLQRIIEGTVENKFILSAGVEQNTLFFQLPPKPSDASRIVFYGPSHPQFAPKLNLTYTEL
ncbi:MAG: DUF4270 family protein [Bacteroidota bacterium]